ncbi:ATP-binding protein [Mesorhizobium sp. STM 4661]|uniref:sensor histidine kinase n=1 Tax=Mesorhizobium sp. STM 4661 TaxID=1297570 RepID=UPI0002BE67B4|nr:ATP-binding protein [Mesorhizobium sp. STM 4661]CCV15184.1 Sensor protein [Mesorhizobium sp. STM 4661]
MTRSTALPLAAIAVMAVIFIFDTVTDMEIAVAVFYVAVVLFSVGFLHRRGIMLLASACIALTVLSYFLTQSGSPRAGLINCVISIAAFGLTTYLCLRTAAAEAAARNAQAQLAHVTRVTTLGELTASIAHEVNQPLAAIVTNGNACQRWLAAEPPNLGQATSTLERIVEDAMRASEVVARIRALVKRAPFVKTPLDLNETVLEAIALARNEIEQNDVSVRMALADGLPPVPADKIQLQQVILNLVANAVDAVRSTDAGPRELKIETRLHDGDGVLVGVHDSGAGFGRQDPERLFDPFHTTKPGGMGMGLAISRSIVEAHGGRIWAAAGTSRGTVLRFTLPQS